MALRVIRLVNTLSNTHTADVIGKQVLHSATEFCSKLGIVEEKADENIYWLELLDELIRETNEIVAMVVASIRTAKHRR